MDRAVKSKLELAEVENNEEISLPPKDGSESPYVPQLAPPSPPPAKPASTSPGSLQAPGPELVSAPAAAAPAPGSAEMPHQDPAPAPATATAAGQGWSRKVNEESSIRELSMGDSFFGKSLDDSFYVSGGSGWGADGGGGGGGGGGGDVVGGGGGGGGRPSAHRLTRRRSSKGLQGRGVLRFLFQFLEQDDPDDDDEQEDTSLTWRTSLGSLDDPAPTCSNERLGLCDVLSESICRRMSYWVIHTSLIVLEPIICSSSPKGKHDQLLSYFDSWTWILQVIVLIVSTVFLLPQIDVIARKAATTTNGSGLVGAARVSECFRRIFLYDGPPDDYEFQEVKGVVVELLCLLCGWVFIWWRPGIAILRCFRVLRILFFNELPKTPRRLVRNSLAIFIGVVSLEIFLVRLQMAESKERSTLAAATTAAATAEEASADPGPEQQQEQQQPTSPGSPTNGASTNSAGTNSSELQKKRVLETLPWSRKMARLTFKVLRFTAYTLEHLGQEMFYFTKDTKGGFILMVMLFYSAYVLGIVSWIDTQVDLDKQLSNPAVVAALANNTLDSNSGNMGLLSNYKGKTLCTSQNTCTESVLRLSVWDGKGFDFLWVLQKNRTFLFAIIVVYLCATSFGILNGLTGIFRNIVTKTSSRAFRSKQDKEDQRKLEALHKAIVERKKIIAQIKTGLDPLRKKLQLVQEGVSMLEANKLRNASAETTMHEHLSTVLRELYSRMSFRAAAPEEDAASSSSSSSSSSPETAVATVVGVPAVAAEDEGGEGEEALRSSAVGVAAAAAAGAEAAAAAAAQKPNSEQ